MNLPKNSFIHLLLRSSEDAPELQQLFQLDPTHTVKDVGQDRLYEFPAIGCYIRYSKTSAKFQQLSYEYPHPEFLEVRDSILQDLHAGIAFKDTPAEVERKLGVSHQHAVTYRDETRLPKVFRGECRLYEVLPHCFQCEFEGSELALRTMTVYLKDETMPD